MNFIEILDGSAAKAVAGVSYVALVAFELYISRRKNKHLYETKDTVINLSLGAITSAVKLLVKGMTLAFFYLVHQYALWDIPAYSVLGFICLFLLNDLVFYLYHRASHESRLFWAMHVAHHSSQIFNVSTAIRGNFIHFLYRFVFWAPLVWLGFDPILVVLVDEISFYYQMWIHTETIRKMPPWFEYIFNTPSHHRVHHASNQQYLDKNYGAVLIVWDRLFGTFEHEEEKVRYGLTKNLEKQSVSHVITHELEAIWQDVRQAKDWHSRWHYVFGHPGWQPQEEEKVREMA